MKKIIQKLDRSSKVLILISLVGIVSSLYFLLNNELGDDVKNKKTIASVTIYQKDTRVKRAGNIHWFNVSQKVDCFNDDTIFTGKDSYATIEFVDGGKITLSPMSLVSLSEGRVNLNSGAIEVNLERGSLAVESFGESIKVTEKTKFKIENTETVKRITPLAKNAPSLEANKKLQAYIQPQVVTLLEPGNGESINQFKDANVRFAWKAGPVGNRTFKVDFARDSGFAEALFTQNVKASEMTLPATRFPAGDVYWKISEVGGTMQNVSAKFSLNDNIQPSTLNPANLSSYPFDSARDKGINFEWSNNLRLPQKLQISRNSEFTDLVTDLAVSGIQTSVKFNQEGAYYWRVGYTRSTPEASTWSVASSFNVEKEIIIAPLQLVAFQKQLDFSLVPNYDIKVRDTNNSQSYEFVILRDRKAIIKQVTSRPIIRLGKLQNGNYVVSVTGKLKNNKSTKPVVDSFVVKNSPPVQAPKIKNKKTIKLFVEQKKNPQLILPQIDVNTRI